jgi:hypothetical protein
MGPATCTVHLDVHVYLVMQYKKLKQTFGDTSTEFNMREYLIQN